MPKMLDFLFFIGRPFGPVYGSLMKIRELCYSRNICKSVKFHVPVISVGNLVLGGTGKTPTVIYIARRLQQEGYSPCIVSRGYGGRSLAPYNVVSTGGEVLKGVEDVGDEPVMMAKSLNNIPVLTGKKRKIPCQYAITELGVDVIILDDGFQHMGVARDVDITLFDSTTLAGNSRIFPGGPLREPVSALHRTTAFLMTGKTDENTQRSEAFAELLKAKFPGKQVFAAGHSTPFLTDSEGRKIDLNDIEAAYIFCGIGNPERFTKTVSQLGVNVKGEKAFNDHTPYTQGVLDSLSGKAKNAGASHLITTAKDFVKIERYKVDLPLLILHVEQEPQAEFDEFLLQSLRDIKQCRSV